MLRQLLQTDASYIITILRIVAGIIILPYGIQKLSGKLGSNFGPGLQATLQQMKQRNLPALIAWLVIIGQSLGSIALIIGLFGRIAAVGNFIIYTGAMITHAKDGWTLNWFGKKKGEGIEYFIMLLTMLGIIIVEGSGALSVDWWVTRTQ